MLPKWKFALSAVLAAGLLIIPAAAGRWKGKNGSATRVSIETETPRGASGWSQEPPNGGAIVWYLGHCGYAVRTRDYFLIFDYQEERDGRQTKSRPARPSLSNGWIDPSELKNLKVRVFISHSHGDHFSPIVFSWRNDIPDIAYYLGWKADFDSSVHYLAGPRDVLVSGGLDISTINSHHSGVPESAFLVKVNDLVIYHNGDCQPADPVAELDFLRTKTDRIDLAFVFPVSKDGEKYTVQNLDFFGKFKVRAAFPMHATAVDPIYFEFQKVFQSKFPGLDISVPMKMGETFIFENGKIKR